jgi:hypothetical protein
MHISAMSKLEMKNRKLGNYNSRARSEKEREGETERHR